MMLSRQLVVGLIGAALFVVILANAHLVYVASKSQPRCVEHTKVGDPEAQRGAFSAAGSSC
jgi:hypothetical protein